LAGGPFGSPDRWKAGDGERIVPGNWERAIGLYRTSDTYIVQSQKQDSPLGAVLWYGPASPLGTIFTPFIVGLSDIPTSFRSGHQLEFDRSTAFWAACIVSNIANLKWYYMIKDIEAVQNQMESNSIALISKLSTYDNAAQIEKELFANAAATVDALAQLQDLLLFKYASGFVNEPPTAMSQMKGYPAWWLQAVGYTDGPPPPPTTPKCCHPNPNVTRKSGNDFTMVTTEQVPVVLTGKAAMRQYLRTTATTMRIDQ
jgi:hypothetical protein